MLIIVSILLLVAGSAFFSGTETAFVSVNRIRLKSRAEEGDKRAARALRIADKYDNAISTILIGNNIVNIFASSLGTLLFTNWMGDAGVGMSTLVMTLLVLTFGEILPKTYAKEHAEELSLAVGGILEFLMKLFYPLVWLFVKLKNLVTRKSVDNTPSVTEDELKVIIEEIEDEGVIKEEESELIQSALEFDDITADEILTPRVDMVSISVTEDIETIRSIFFESKFSRIPVYDDGIDDIIGILYEREFLRALLTGGDKIDIRKLLKKPIFIHEKMRISALCQQMQRTKAHMALVTDQYGGIVGLVTMEDILEELVGEIYDEDDVVEMPCQQLEEGVFLVRGDYNVYDMFDDIGYNCGKYESKHNTVSGWATEILDHIPETGDTFTFNDCIGVEIRAVDDKRAAELLVRYTPPEEEDEEEDEEKDRRDKDR